MFERFHRPSRSRGCQACWCVLCNVDRRVSFRQGGRGEILQLVRVADINEPRSTGHGVNPPIQLCFGEYRSAAVWEIRLDKIGRKSSAETAGLGQPLVMGADDSEVTGASFAGAFCHGTQPVGWILLSDALWHGRKVFGVDPATAVVLGVQVIPARINASGIELFCSGC